MNNHQVKLVLFLSLLCFIFPSNVLGKVLSKLDRQINTAKKTLKMGDPAKASKMFHYILKNSKGVIQRSPRYAETFYYYGVALEKLSKLNLELSKKAYSKARAIQDKQIQAHKEMLARKKKAEERAKKVKLHQIKANKEMLDRRKRAADRAEKLQIGRMKAHKEMLSRQKQAEEISSKARLEAKLEADNYSSSQPDKNRASAENVRNKHRTDSSSSDSKNLSSNKYFNTNSNSSNTINDAKNNGKATSLHSNAYSLKSLKNDKAIEHYRKGAAYLDEGLKKEASIEFIKALKYEENNVKLLSKTGILLIEIGGSSFNRGQKILKRLYKIKSNKISNQALLALAEANLYSQKPDLKQNLVILTNHLKNAPKDVAAHILLGETEYKRKKYGNSISAFNKALKIDNKNLRGYLGVGNSLIGLSKYDKAVKFFSTAREFWPDSVLPLLALGKVHFILKNYGNALAMFNLAFDKQPDDFDVNLSLTEILLKANDSRASTHLEKCISIDPEHPSVQYWSAISNELDKKLSKAKKAYTQLSFFNDETAWKAKLRLGQLYSGEGHKTFPGSLVFKVWPNIEGKYKRMLNRRLAYYYYIEVIAKDKTIKEANEINHWIEENEDKVKQAIEFDRSIQNQFKNR